MPRTKKIEVEEVEQEDKGIKTLDLNVAGQLGGENLQLVIDKLNEVIKSLN